jgi:GAF domain-containing protein
MARQSEHAVMDVDARIERYEDVLRRVAALLDGEDDWVSAMATVVSELHHAFPFYHWTGFYRVVDAGMLAVGPYQGGHGCIRIAFGQGVCGKAAEERRTLIVPDVHAFPGHIACSPTTQSEIVVPVTTPSGVLLAVLDVDSDIPDAFSSTDRQYLEALCHRLGRQFG